LEEWCGQRRDRSSRRLAVEIFVEVCPLITA
jgi:hypothetical protein